MESVGGRSREWQYEMVMLDQQAVVSNDLTLWADDDAYGGRVALASDDGGILMCYCGRCVAMPVREWVNLAWNDEARAEYSGAAHIARDIREGRFPQRSEPTDEDLR